MLDLLASEPGSSKGSLLSTLLEAADGADRGGAVFAWATRRGVDLLLGDDGFEEFLGHAPFDLVVGTDSITDTAAIIGLRAWDAQFQHLTAHAHYHDRPGVLFHPKVAWFGRGNLIRLIVGSGNLTGGGLTGNWEALIVTDLRGVDARRAEKQLADWRGRLTPDLRPLSDPAVLARAKRNTGRERDFKGMARRKAPPPAPSSVPSTGLDALVAEIPKNRAGQADMTKGVLLGYFGWTQEDSYRALLRAVESDGSVGPLESRPAFGVQSRNYRLELASLHTLLRSLPGEYPSTGEGRPIGLFVRAPDGVIHYRIVLPGGREHGELDAFLTTEVGAPGPPRRVTIDVAEVRAACPRSAMWKAKLDED